VVERQLPLLSNIKNKYFKMTLLFTIVLVVTLVSSITLSLFILNVQAQESSSTTNQKQIFRVNVQVTNNADIDEIGTLHVSIDGTNISKVLNGVTCPAKSTVSYKFEFNSNDVPVGKGFTAEMVYGDDIFKRTYGVNTPSNTPEIVQITLP
jgi:NhaP-type Na+/H+ and K+/H+ antiporter